MRILVLALLHEKGFEELKGLANFLFADLGQVHDLAEGAGDVVAATGEKDTTGNHHFGGLALEEAALLGILE